MRRPVALDHAGRLVNHGPTVLVTTEHQGRRNIMAAAWSMPVEFTPPRIAEPHSEQAYDTVFGEAVSAQADDRVFAHGRWSSRDDNVDWHTLHHLGGGAFAVPSRVIQGHLQPR